MLKIDVEGHEADVLAGAVKTLRRWRPYIVAEELSGHDEVERLIKTLGYKRLPVNLAVSPTRIYSPSTRASLRVFAVPEYRRLAKQAVGAPRTSAQDELEPCHGRVSRCISS